MNINEARTLFAKISTTQVCDAAKVLRVLEPTIKPFVPNPKMVGKAFTVKAYGDLIPVLKALELANDENVIIIDSGQSPFALAGELFASEAKRKNIAGIVIDGFCRDAVGIGKVGIPFYAKGVFPKAGTKNKVGELNVPITCGGVEIFPGDMILGDENGIVSIPEQQLLDVLKLAVEIEQKEQLALEKISNGGSILELFNFHEHYNKLLNDESSVFAWK